MRNAIGYIRVSTEEQSSDDKFGVESQRQAISGYARGHYYEIKDWFIDAVSGIKDSRPELDRILYQSDRLPPHEVWSL